jgi:PAS domain S-box-containing protein
MVDFSKELVYVKDIFEHSDFVFFKWKNDENWSVEFVSNNTKSILGYEADQFKSAEISYASIIIDEDIVFVRKEVEKFSNEGVSEFVHQPYRIKKLDGEIRWVYDRTKILRDSDGNITYYLGYIIDITDLKNKELELEKSVKEQSLEIQERKEIFRTLFYKSHDGVILIENNKLIDCNDSIIQMLGYKEKKNIIGKKIYKISPFIKENDIKSLKELSTMLKKTYQNGQNKFECSFKTQHGNNIWVEVVFTKFVIFDRVLIHGLFRDISDRKSMEIQLRELNNKLKYDVKLQKSIYTQLFNESGDGVVVIENSSNTFKMIDCNSSVVNLFGYENKKEFLTTPFEKLFPKKQPSGEYSKIFLLKKFINVKRNKTCNFECINLKNSNEKLWLDTTLTYMQLEDNQNIIHLVVRDISKRKALELENKRQSLQLIKQSRMVLMGEMLSMIAHQWRQPLSAITTTTLAIKTKLLAKKFKYNTEKEIEKNENYLSKKFNTIDKHVMHLTQTIDDFRYFFKPDKEKHLFYISDVIDKSLSMIEGAINSAGIKIVREYHQIDKIESYENEIIQVVLNILNNAIEAIRNENITEPTISIKIYEGENHLQCVCIHDNGGGIEEEIINRIFEPYFSTKSKNGTGLGLYMSQTIIQEHCQGTLEVKNLGSGANFQIKLPPRVS